MTPSRPLRLQVALAASPVLLRDVLRSLLPAEMAVTVVADEPVGARFDLALLTLGSRLVDADVVVLLDDGPAARGGGSIHACGMPPRRLEDVEALREFLNVLGRRWIHEAW